MEKRSLWSISSLPPTPFFLSFPIVLLTYYAPWEGDLNTEF